MSARSEETYQGSIDPGTYVVSGLQAVTDSTGAVTDLALTQDETSPPFPPGEHMRETDTLISGGGPNHAGCSAGSSYHIDYIGFDASGWYQQGVPASLVEYGQTGMTGWNVDPSGTWTPETGGVLAEKRFTS